MCLILFVHFSKGSVFIAAEANRRLGIGVLTGILSEAASAIWNINEVILHCRALQTDAKTSLFVINHSYSDSLVLLGHCLILSAMEKEKVNWFTLQKRCCVWNGWCDDERWNIFDLLMIMNLWKGKCCIGDVMGVIIKRETGEKSLASSKCSRVRFSEIAFFVPTHPFQ